MQSGVMEANVSTCNLFSVYGCCTMLALMFSVTVYDFRTTCVTQKCPLLNTIDNAEKNP